MRRPKSCDDETVIAPRVAETVIDDARLTVFDADGRRMERGIGFHRRYLARDPIPQVRRPKA